VLSREGRLDAADRWYAGGGGPEAPIARSAPASCGTCGFYLPLSGVLRLAFGVCANVVTPDDGRVVSADHGCGAHSEAGTDLPPLLPEPPPVLLDTMSFDRLVIERDATATQPTPSPEPGLPAPDPEPALPQPDPEPLELPEPGPVELPEPAEPTEPLVPGLPETPGVPEMSTSPEA
jgi:hypothetical protein